MTGNQIKSRLWTPQTPLNGLKGVNVTASEQTTLDGELSGGQNVFTDMSAAIYNRSGSVLLGGMVDIYGCQGGWVFRDNEQRIAIVTVINGIIYYLNGTSLVKIPNSPTLSTTLDVNGIFYPEKDKFYLTNGTDSVVELDQSSGSITAISQPTMQKCLFLGHHQNSLVFLNLPGAPNSFIISDEAAITSSAALSTQVTNGYILGMENLDAYTSVVVTDQMAYRMVGVTVNADGNGNFGLLPGTFHEIFRSRAVAPRSIISINNAVYWVGLDAFNTAEIYRCDGQQVVPVGWSKIKTYLRAVNTAALQKSCAIQYGVYAKFCIPGEGSGFPDTELLLDTARSVSYTESGQYGPPQIVWEPKHIPGFNIAQYAVWRTSGQEFIVGFDAINGYIHRTGTGLFDELPVVDGFPATGATPTTATVTVTSTTPLAQPFSFTSNKNLLTAGLAITAGVGTVTFSVQADVAGSPSGTDLYSTSLILPTALPPVIYGTFSPPAVLTAGNTYHLVTSIAGGTLSVTKQTTTTLTAYRQKSGSSWIAGTGTPYLLVTGQTDIDAYFIHTTNMEQPLAKKKATRFLVNALSSSGASMTVGVGNQGRDSTFVDTSFSLTGAAAVWGVSAGPQPTNVLHWAAVGDLPTSTNSWASATADYERTVMAPWYSVPSHYVSIRMRSVGQADWRINTYLPIVALQPTTVA